MAATSSSGSTATLSPWKVHTQPNPINNLSEIMDEEMAKNLQDEEHVPIISKATVDGPNNGSGLDFDSYDCSSDLALAMYLQSEYDQEHDKILGREQAKYNGSDKIQVSFEKYRVGLSSAGGEDDSDDEEDLREYLNQCKDNHQSPTFGPSGVIRTSDGEFITKHDVVICGRRNTANMLRFPPDFQTGDAAKSDMRLPNRVFNSLKSHSLSEEKRRKRLHEKKERSTAEMALDARTRLIVYKMESSGLLESVNGIISTGKEATILHATAGPPKEDDDGGEPSEYAIKVYKTTLNEFKNRVEYVKDDYRFRNPHKVMAVWAERELMNLNRMKRAELLCPTVIKLKKHVLVMSFIGENGVAAPKLKDANLNEDELNKAYHQCVQISLCLGYLMDKLCKKQHSLIESFRKLSAKAWDEVPQHTVYAAITSMPTHLQRAMTKLYNTCNLVHGDFSEFNILYWDNSCYIIDVSQSMDTSHPRCLTFLARDCQNLTQFFATRGVNTASARELFNSVTGLSIQSDENFLLEIQKFSEGNRHLERCADKKHPADCVIRRLLENDEYYESDADDYQEQP